MPVSFPAPPGKFVGRADYLARFRARLEHFQIFLLGGMPGAGKTSLALRLAKECHAAGLSGAIYLPLWPSETVASIVARLEVATGQGRGSSSLAHGDPYARLTETLNSRKLALVLDDVHNLRREDLLALLRAARAKQGNYRIIAAGRGEPELSAIDRMSLHVELVGPLKPDEVEKLARSEGLAEEKVQLLVADAARGGASAHPLNISFLLGIFKNQLPPPTFFEGQSARSVNAFRALVTLAQPLMEPAEVAALSGLARVGIGIERAAAARAFGPAVGRLLKRGLLQLIAGDVYAHPLVGQALGSDERELGESVTKLICRHLKRRGEEEHEPLRVLRAVELLARIGASSDAVDTLTDSWETARDLGFLEAYLKTVAAIPTKPALDSRLKLLSARARMQQGNMQNVREELESLVEDKDAWTRARAHAALTSVYNGVGENRKAVAAFEAVKRSNVGDEISIPAAVEAANAMVRINKLDEAEKLARATLARTRGNKRFADRQGELHRLLARVHVRNGALNDAVLAAEAAAKAFEAAGDFHHAATAYGFIGDIHRETGEFELAKAAFSHFHALAQAWGDRDLLQVAELADAWVSLDIGDLTHAARQIAAVEKEMSAAPSRRLRRYLAAAKALLEAGRGHHDVAADQLVAVIDAWQSAGQRNIADILRAQRVRSLIACNQIDKARDLVQEALTRLDAKTEAPRVAAFLRESALIRLRRKDVGKAMAELASARKLFAAGGNRREEALTLYRIAHAALEEGDTELAGERVNEALALARKIKHTRVIALCRELMGRLALQQDDGKTAVAAAKEALAALRRLGDEIGSLHVSESLLRAHIATGDLASAIRLGPRISDQAEKLEIREVRVRAIILTGVALLRRGRVEPASRCFREIPEAALSPFTTALMWRLGEALSSFGGNLEELLERRGHWVAALKRLPETQQATARHALEQLDLAPRERCRLRTREGEVAVGTEEIGWRELEEQVDLFVDVHNGRIRVGGEPLVIDNAGLHRLFNHLVIAAPAVLDNAAIYRVVFGGEPAPKFEKKLKTPLRQLDKLLKGVKHVRVTPVKNGLKLALPRSFAFLLPPAAALGNISPLGRQLLRVLRRFSTQPLPALQERLGVNRSTIRRELAQLAKVGLVEPVRDGRGQAFRLI
jgi:tetratricopeptide (TPR) repeat protein